MIDSNESISITIPAERVLNVTGGMDTDGMVYRLPNAPGENFPQASWALKSGTTIIGPFPIPIRVRLECNLGPFTYTLEEVATLCFVRATDATLPAVGKNDVIYATETGWYRFDELSGTYTAVSTNPTTTTTTTTTTPGG
jgi:hypothetical protein